MRKIIMNAVIILSALGFVTMSFAQGTKPQKQHAVKTETVSGKIVSIDQPKAQVVVKTADGSEKTLTVDPKEIASLKVGESAAFSVAAGSNKAKTLKKLKVNKKSY